MKDLVTPYAMSKRTKIAWRLLRPALQNRGVEILRICGLERVAATDFEDFLEASRQPTPGERAERLKVIRAMVLDAVPDR